MGTAKNADSRARLMGIGRRAEGGARADEYSTASSRPRSSPSAYLRAVILAADRGEVLLP
jgi:hypothetical protein